MNETKSKQPRILLVEDEVLVRMFAVDALEDAGACVESAGTGAEGLAKFQLQPAEFAAAIVDLGLPDGPGDAVASALRALRADLPLLIASGRSERELQLRFASDKRVAFLVKPYTASMLVSVLQGMGLGLTDQA
jgi:DNA-binding response OmpR family regulator